MPMKVKGQGQSISYSEKELKVIKYQCFNIHNCRRITKLVLNQNFTSLYQFEKNTTKLASNGPLKNLKNVKIEKKLGFKKKK